jgi:hypothetical protein
MLSKETLDDIVKIRDLTVRDFAVHRPLMRFLRAQNEKRVHISYLLKGEVTTKNPNIYQFDKGRAIVEWELDIGCDGIMRNNPTYGI